MPPPSYEEVVTETWDLAHQRRVAMLREFYSSNNSYAAPTRQHQPVSVNRSLTAVAGEGFYEHSLVNTLGTQSSAWVESGAMEELINLIRRNI